MSMRPGIIALCVLGLALGGCASTVVHRPAAAESGGNQAGAWEAVLPAGGLQLAAGPEDSRRDDALNFRDPSVFAPDAWPDRPSLDGARRLFLNDRADELLYFRTDHRSYRSGSWRY